ncbi:phage portal protein [bacterium]|nr:MAG: phage portal protein [bacterium]
MPNPLTLLGDSLKAIATSQRLSFAPSTSGMAPSNAWLGSFPSGAKKDYGALVGDPLQNYVIAAAVNAVSLALPDAPPYLENLQDGRWVRIDDHPVLGFLRQPHEDLDDAEVWSLTSLYRLTRGEAFWILHLSDAGQPTEAVPCDPRRVRVIGTRDELISGYEITTEDGRLLPFPKQQVMHFRHLPDPNNMRRGWTPLSTGTRHLVGSNAASTYHTALLLNGAVSSWLISLRDSGQNNVTPEQFQTFIDAMRRKYSGTTETSGGIDGLSLPLDIHRMAYSPDEMAIDKLVNYYEQTLCCLTGVSKKLLDLGSDATYMNLREAISDFWERRLVPMRNKDARALTNQLLPLFGLSPAQWRVQFDFSNVPALQENQDALFVRWRDLYKAGGIDLYTLQTKIGLPTVPEEYKERFWGTPPKEEGEESPESIKGLGEALNRMFHRGKTTAETNSGSFAPFSFSDGHGNSTLERIREGLEKSDISKQQRDLYRARMHEVMSKMPPEARRLLDMNVKEFKFYKSLEHLGAAFNKDKLYGAYDKEIIHVDGGKTPEETAKHYAHELTHAFHGRYGTLIDNEKWKEAWRREAPRLRNCPPIWQNDPAEFWAGLGEHLYTGRHGFTPERFRSLCPMAYAYWSKLGLIPEESQ